MNKYLIIDIDLETYEITEEVNETRALMQYLRSSKQKHLLDIIDSIRKARKFVIYENEQQTFYVIKLDKRGKIK